MSPLYRDMLDTAVEAAVEAGKITLQYFQTSSFEVELKSDRSPVTIADRRAEERIAEIVGRRFPEHAILGEEHGLRGGSAPITWIVDPIDGTKSFIHGVPLYGVMIGVEIEGAADVGVVHFPALGETYYAARGFGSYWNGRRMRVSETASLANALLVSTASKRFPPDSDVGRAQEELAGRTALQRTWGDCYGHMLVASGRAEIMLDPRMSVWDCAPLAVIVEEAGGIFTDWSGARTIHGGSAISTNAHLHHEVMEIIHASSPAAAMPRGEIHTSPPSC
jgi:histidinol phosphatase-like enzyme (inositol monophosphatase family)